MARVSPPNFNKVHFLKLEAAPPDNEDTFKYNLKNHFDTVVIQVEGKFSEEFCGRIELEATDFRRKKQTEDPPKLFRVTIQKGEENEESENDGTSKLHCEVLSMSGHILGYITAVKDDSLSTYDYTVTDDTKSSKLSLKRKHISEDHIELHVAPIARINIEQSQIFLSMSPELDTLSKTRLMCSLMLLELTENHLDNGGEQQSPPSHSTSLENLMESQSVQPILA